MTAKEWLMRGWKIDREIEALLQTRRETWERLTSTTADYASEAGQGESDPHKYDKLIKLDETINQRIDLLVDTKKEIIDTVAQVQDSRYRTLLTERYTAFKTWEQIAVDMGYNDVRHVYRLHGGAIQAIRDVIVCHDGTVV